MGGKEGGKGSTLKSLVAHNQGDCASSFKQGVSDFEQGTSMTSFVF